MLVAALVRREARVDEHQRPDRRLDRGRDRRQQDAGAAVADDDHVAVVVERPGGEVGLDRRR